MLGGFEKPAHLRRGAKRGRMRHGAGVGDDVVGHLPNHVELPVGRLRQQHRHEVLEGENAELHLHEWRASRRGSGGVVGLSR